MAKKCPLISPLWPRYPKSLFIIPVCIYEKTSKLRVYANRDEVQSFLNLDFNITLESVYYPLMETEQNSSFSDTDVKKEKEYRQKSSLCLSTVSGEEKDYRLQSEYKKTTAENICWVSYIS